MLLPRRAVPLAIALAIGAAALGPQAAEAAGKTVLMHLEPEGSPWDDLAWSAMEQIQKDTGAQIKRIGEARETLDRAKTPADLNKARTVLEPKLAELKAGLDALDRYKNSSHLLADYDALLTALADSYPAAKLAAMSGKPESLSQARNAFDGHLRAMHSWLERLDKDMDEALEEGQ